MLAGHQPTTVDKEPSNTSAGLGGVSYRTFDAETAKQFTYVIGK